MHDGDAVTDGHVVEVGVGRVIGRAFDVHVLADLTILVDDRAADRAPLADSHARLLECFILGGRTRDRVEVGSHEDRVSNRDVSADVAAKTDHAPLDAGSRLDDATVRQEALGDRCSVDAGGGSDRACV